METLRKEIRAQVARLEGAFPQPGSTEEATLTRLRILCTAAHQTQQAGDLTHRFAELRQYWLDSIDWCSQLSKDIEKLLIMHDDLVVSEIETP